MGFKRQHVAYDLSDPRAADAPDPTADLSLNYELELANFATIPDHEKEPEEEEPLPEPEEPAPANLDPSRGPISIFGPIFKVENRCGNPSTFTPIRTDCIVNKLGWVPAPENLLSANAVFGETACG